MTTLCERREAFVIEYHKTRNAYQSYCKAYSHEDKGQRWIYTESSKLLRHPDIIPRLKELREQSRLQIDDDFIAKGVLDIIEDAKQAGDRTNALKGYALLSTLTTNMTDQEERSILPRRQRYQLVETIRQRMEDEKKVKVVDVTPNK